MNNKKLDYLKNHQKKLKIFRTLLQQKEFNIYEFVSVFNPLINSLLTSILIFTDNLRIITILVAIFNITIALYLSVHKYYLSNEVSIENRILINNSNNLLGNLQKLEHLYDINSDYILQEFENDLYKNCFDLESEMQQYITPKKVKKLNKITDIRTI
tara:strand:- start:791 stop:1261 length:471 start_codon:yes stop_codon:yes gene_type:complete